MIALLLMLAAALDCTDPISQSDMTLCAARDLAVADAELNAQWKKSIAAARPRDAADPAGKGMLGYADAALFAKLGLVPLAGEDPMRMEAAT